MQKVFIKWIRSAALFLAVALIGAGTGLAQVSVDLSQLVGRPGETGVVTVSISGVESGTAIQAFGFQVVADAGITITGIDAAGTLTESAGFSSGIGPNGVGAFAQGTDITTSGKLIKITFDLDATAAGTITLTNFLFNAGNPAVGNDPPSGNFVVSERMLKVEDHLALPEDGVVHENDEFTVKIFVQDAFTVADNVIAFSIDFNFDPSLFTIDTSRGSNGIITSGTMNSSSVVSVNPMGPGIYRIGGFVTGDAYSGTGTFLEVAAIAGNAPGILGPGNGFMTLTNVMFNTGLPIYGAFPGEIIIFPFNVATEDAPETPSEFVLDGNYPNPFNPTTNIQFDLPESARVSVQVMDLLGREVMAIPAQNFTAGSNQTIQISGDRLVSGLYLYRVISVSQAKTSIKVGTMTLLK